MADLDAAGMRVTDSGRGPAVVLLHGQPGYRHDWAEVTARLSADFRVVAPDRPGYGETGGAAVGLADNAEAVCGLLDALDVQRAIVAGHSLGGGIALSLALRHPERVAALVLVASIGTDSSLNAFDRLLAWPVVGERLAFVGFRYLGRFLLMPAGRNRTPFGPELSAVPAEAVERRLRRWQDEQVWRSFSAEQRALVAETPAIAAALGTIAASTYVVGGRQDSIVPMSTTEELAGAIPGARLRWADGGHLLPWENPDVVAAVIREAADPPPVSPGCVS